METQPSQLSVFGRLPKRIVIVGNGESAWMSGASLARAFGKLGCRITVVTSGRGESEFPGETTLPSMLGLLSNLGVDDHDMLRACQGVYQLAVQYSDWVQPDRDFWRPLSSGLQRGLTEMIQGWHGERIQGRLLRPLHSYALHWSASLAGKGPSGFSGPSSITKTGSHAFHVDGKLLAGWFRHQALTNGTEEIVGDVAEASPNGRGGIAQIRLTGGAAVAGDFFIDATGSGRPLLPLAATEFVSWKDSFPGDQMISLSLPGRRQVSPFTRITGLRGGWMWHTPLVGSISVGCVTDSRTTDRDAALAMLKDALRLDGLLQHAADGGDNIELVPEFRMLSTGYRATFWKDNVLAIGAAACQLDPLISAGRHLTQVGVELFMELFPERSGQPASSDYYNSRMALVADELRDFAQLHYHLSQREDSAFWQSARMAPISEALRDRLALFDATANLDAPLSEGFRESDYWHLFAGCGRLPKRPAMAMLAADPAMIQQGLRSLLKSNEAELKDLPLHEDLLDWIHAPQRPDVSSSSVLLPVRSAS